MMKNYFVNKEDCLCKNNKIDFVEKGKSKKDEKTEKKKREKLNDEGCGCIRSHCRKNYCKCFEGKKRCGLKCKCRKCWNDIDR